MLGTGEIIRQMTPEKLEANYVSCATCNMSVPLSSVVVDKGQMLPELMQNEQRNHVLNICDKCYHEGFVRSKYKNVVA